MFKYKILLMAVLSYSSVCSAADFLLHVPINLTELYNIKTVTVTCRVGADGYSTSQAAGTIEDTFYGSNSVTKAVVNDTLVTVFDVAINMGENSNNIAQGEINKSKEIINAYYCNTLVCTTPSSCDRLTINHSNPSFRTKPNTQSHSRAYGSISSLNN